MQYEGNRVETSLNQIGIFATESRFSYQFFTGAITMKFSLAALTPPCAVASSDFGFDFPPITPPQVAE